MKRPRITISAEELSEFNVAVQKEWLITNGLGGYASSTVLGLNTRKYHGLLVAALHPPGDRTVFLAKLDEDIFIEDSIYRLGTNEFKDTIFPQGHLFLKEFSVSPFPTSTYQIKNLIIKKTILMPNKKNATIAMYTILNESGKNAKLRVYPLMTCRHFHKIVNQQINPLNFRQENKDRKIKLTFTEPNSTVLIYASAGKFVENPNWINALHYREETARGEIDTDDVYQPGFYEISIVANNETKFSIAASASENNQDASDTLDSLGSSLHEFDPLLAETSTQQTMFLKTFYSSHKTIVSKTWLNWVLLATNSFVTGNIANEKSIIAGYFWFEPWGRDTFISLPGLLLVTGRFEDAKNVLQNYSRYCKNGLVPNLMPDASGQPVYTTVDGTFWYVNAVLQFLKYTGDFKFVQEQLWIALKSIVENHEQGTDFDIHLDSDGLISHGERLTWMDANIDGKAVTPRAGKAVEIQALWYNTLQTMGLLANRFGEKNLVEKYAAMADKAMESFNEKFWNTQKDCLFDVLNASGPDPSIRPNQIIATSLDFRMLDARKIRHILDLVQEEFLTPCGLRTLSRNDSRYKNVYNGDINIRDRAYHNGTVWPWLLGPFITAYLKTGKNIYRTIEFDARTFLHTFFVNQIFNCGLGTINEIFDGAPPYKARGCIAQAWSVAEPLRAYIEDTLQIRPRYEHDVLKFSL